MCPVKCFGCFRVTLICYFHSTAKLNPYCTVMYVHRYAISIKWETVTGGVGRSCASATKDPTNLPVQLLFTIQHFVWPGPLPTYPRLLPFSGVGQNRFFEKYRRYGIGKLPQPTLLSLLIWAEEIQGVIPPYVKKKKIKLLKYICT